MEGAMRHSSAKARLFPVSASTSGSGSPYRPQYRKTGAETSWNQTRGGELLGMTRDQIHYRMEEFGLLKDPSA